ncbi:MAG: ATP-binding cassette domain-containing protein [Coprococcus sp.]|nr:ATP-binding cassette domain-containing protein [Coprococcus sp.]
MKLELAGLSKKYGDIEALTNVGTVLENGVYGLLGANGAGKSTLMNIITGLLKPTKGEILVDGVPVGKLGKKYREQLGYLPQTPGLYGFYTGRELLTYFAKLKGVDSSKKHIDELLELVHLVQDGDKKVGGYSGGMKKRIGIAIALLNKPQLLILDEPTAGLDTQERISLRGIISKIKYDSIIIISTHIVSDVEYIADNILLMKNGLLLRNVRYNDLINEMKGNVWSIDVPAESVLELSEKYIVTSAVNIDRNMVELRIVNDTKPFDNGVGVYPTLEDAYMKYLRRND